MLHTAKLIAFTFIGACLLRSQGNLEAGAAARRQQYLELSRRIYSHRADPTSERQPSLSKEEGEAITIRLREMLDETIVEQLNSAHPSAPAIDKALAVVQSDSLALPAGDMTNTPFAALYQTNSTQAATVAFVILRGGDAIPDTAPQLEFFGKDPGGWQRKAAAPTEVDFRGCDFFVAQMDSGTPGETWWLAWGTTIGDTGARLRARLYGYDGAAIRTIWRRDELVGGSLSAKNNVVTLTYDRAYHQRANEEPIKEVLRITPNGLERAP